MQLAFTTKKHEPSYDELEDAIKQTEYVMKQIKILKEKTPFIQQQYFDPMGHESLSHPCDVLMDDIRPVSTALHAKYGRELRKHGQLMNKYYNPESADDE